jgi:hypothetical protein
MTAKVKELTKMGIAKFNTNGNGYSLLPESELDSLLNRMEGVVDWAVGRQGELAIEYDRDLINCDSIELDLSEIGLVLENIYDDDPLTVDQSVFTFLNT